MQKPTNYDRYSTKLVSSTLCSLCLSPTKSGVRQVSIGRQKSVTHTRRHTIASFSSNLVHMTRISKCSRLAASASEVLARDESKTAVVDFYLLGQSRDGIDLTQIRSVQESLWSVQYAIPGVVASFFGSVPECRCHDDRTFDFAIVFRFSNAAACKNFLENERFSTLLKTSFQEASSDLLTFTIQQHVMNDLETIFRKGPQFEEGCDHVIVTQLAESQNAEDAIQFLSVLGEVTTQSEIGASSTSLGTLVETSDAQLQSELLIMATHVGNVQGVKNLEAMPPVQQLWEENGNGLLRAVISFAIQLDTSEK